MSHTVTVHPLVVMGYRCIALQSETLPVGKFLGPDFLFLVHLAIEAVKGIRDVLKFL